MNLFSSFLSICVDVYMDIYRECIERCEADKGSERKGVERH